MTGDGVRVSAHRLALVALAVAAAPLDALACGACKEDALAATYDHRVVEHANRHGDRVVHARVEGPAVDPRKLASAAQRVPGVRAGSARASSAPPALSFALDPSRQTPAGALAAVERKVPGLRLVAVAGG